MAINPGSLKGLTDIFTGGGGIPARAHFVPVEDEPATDDRTSSPPSDELDPVQEAPPA